MARRTSKLVLPDILRGENRAALPRFDKFNGLIKKNQSFSRGVSTYSVARVRIRNDGNEVGGYRGDPMKSSILKRSVVIEGHKTSVSLEDAFWNDLKKIAQTQRATLSELVGKIDGARQHGNLSSAIRLFVLGYFHTEHAVANDETAQALHP